MKPERIATENAPSAIGPYSQGMRVGDLIFFSGQVPLDPKTGQIVGSTIEEQTEQVCRNIAGLLASQGKDFYDVVKTTVFLQSMDEFTRFNEVYGRHFKEPYPARSTVAVAGLPKGARVEIECIVYCPHG